MLIDCLLTITSKNINIVDINQVLKGRTMKKATSLDVYNIALFNSNQKAQMISDLETLKVLKKAITNEENKLKERAIKLNKAHYVVTSRDIPAKDAYTQNVNTFTWN
jgi:hypothetical protein